MATYTLVHVTGPDEDVLMKDYPCYEGAERAKSTLFDGLSRELGDGTYVSIVSIYRKDDPYAVPIKVAIGGRFDPDGLVAKRFDSL